MSPLIQELIDALRCLPGVGPKTAQRMAFQILERNRDNGLSLARILEKAITQVGHCKRCRTLSETDLCKLCCNMSRHANLLCIVETPMDVLAIEQTGTFRGYYFVLMGHLSPLDGIGPKEIGMDELKTRLIDDKFNEVIIATNPTVEGEATAHYIATLAKEKNIRCSRIAHGVPMGGELEYLDTNTLTHAFTGRTLMATEC